MKVTAETLRRIIKEEVARALNEWEEPAWSIVGRKAVLRDDEGNVIKSRPATPEEIASGEVDFAGHDSTEDVGSIRTRRRRY